MADLQKRQFIEEKKTREALERLGTVSFPGGTS
jgi:hypothetical protein